MLFPDKTKLIQSPSAEVYDVYIKPEADAESKYYADYQANNTPSGATDSPSPSKEIQTWKMTPANT